MTAYQKLIQEIDKTVTATEARGVEASMRLQYGTLGHLSRDTFKSEISLFRACEKHQPGYGASLAASYGL